jgi:hypothetical protein
MDQPKITCMPFDCVIRALKLGRKCSRPNWGKSDFIVIEDTEIKYKGALPGMVLNHSYEADSEDMLATDWYIPED